MTKRVAVPWTNEAGLRLALPGDVVALYDGDRKLDPAQYVLDENAGAIFLMAAPAGEITAQLKAEAPAVRHAAKSDGDGP